MSVSSSCIAGSSGLLISVAALTTDDADFRAVRTSSQSLHSSPDPFPLERAKSAASGLGPNSAQS